MFPWVLMIFWLCVGLTGNTLVSTFAALAAGTNTSAADSLVDEDDETIDDAAPHDPLQSLNRIIFGVNQSLDAAILKPVAHVYMGLVPAKGRQSISNFLQNLSEPISFLNHGFQKNSDSMKITLIRFFLNTFMGFFGTFDVAKELGYEAQKQGFMDTLAKAGLGTGPYLVLPLIGPSNLRDASGFVVDWVYDPVGYVIKNQNKNAPHYMLGMKIVDRRASANEIIESLNKSVDPYKRYRLMYTEYRRGQDANIEEYDAPMPEEASHIPTPKPHS